MKAGDKVVITRTESIKNRIGSVATLAYQDSGGDWWARFDDDFEICLQNGFTEYELVDKKVNDDDLSWIMKFIEIKSSIIPQSKDAQLMHVEDWHWLLELPVTKAKKIRKHITKFLRAKTGGRDADICPWCIVEDKPCADCAYAKTHGICATARSTYSKLAGDHEPSFTRFTNIIRDNIDKFKCLLPETKEVYTVKSRTEIVKVLLSEGFEMKDSGRWDIPLVSPAYTRDENATRGFSRYMFDFCDKTLEGEPIKHNDCHWAFPNGYNWRKSWLNIKEVEVESKK